MQGSKLVLRHYADTRTSRSPELAIDSFLVAPAAGVAANKYYPPGGPSEAPPLQMQSTLLCFMGTQCVPCTPMLLLRFRVSTEAYSVVARERDPLITLSEGVRGRHELVDLC